MILVIVYVGAVAVLFLFVVMMLDVDFAELRRASCNYLADRRAGRPRSCSAELIAGRAAAWPVAPAAPRSRVAEPPMPRRASATPRRSATSSTRTMSTTSRSPGWCCWSP